MSNNEWQNYHQSYLPNQFMSFPPYPYQPYGYPPYQQQTNNFQHMVLDTLNGIKTETEQLKLLFSVNRNDMINVNNYIDKSIKEMEKINIVLNNSNEKIESIVNKVNSYDSRINKAFKEIKKLKNKMKNFEQSDEDNNNDGKYHKSSKLKKNHKKSSKETSHKHCHNHNNDDDEDDEDEDEDDGEDKPIIKTITIGLPPHQFVKNNMGNNYGPKLPLFNFMSTLFGNQSESEEKAEKNDLVDSEDDIDDTFDIYDTSYIKEKKVKNMIDIELDIKTIDDLIELGLTYKNTETETKKKIPPATISGPFIPPPVLPMNFANKQFPMKKITGNELKNDLSDIIMSKILNKSFESKDENTNNIENDTQSNDSKDNTKKETNGDKIRPYYKFNGKRYSIDIQKIINLIVPLQKLKRMIGMTKVKEHILDLILYYIQGFENSTKDMLHTSIEGPPGVGKTRLGRILAQIYSALGVIPSSRFKRVRRTDLIGKYLGHTAHKTQEVIDETEGGVLFIDEAYSLGSGEKDDIYSKECIDTINMNLTEKKKNLIVIIAGYTDQLDKSFFALNEGLKRRFPFRFQIDGYDEKELTDIFYSKIKKMRWKLHTELSKEYLNNFFKQEKDKFKNFGGDIETVLMNCKMIHAKRVLGKKYKYKKIITIEDLKKAFDKFVVNKKEEVINDSVKMMYQ